MATYAGRLLRLDLTNRVARREAIPESVISDFVGGRGLGIKYLYDELSPGVDPLGPENRLLFLTGVLGGTTAQGFSRWMAMTKSPLTGCLGRAVGGGSFGAHLKFAGFDLLIVEGRAAEPVYVLIEENAVRFLEAGDLWGRDTQETQAVLIQRHGPGTQVAGIGPAGERLVRYATITHGRRTASRCGVGTVMGAKNLKAVAVKGRGRLAPVDPAAFRRAVRQQIEILKSNPRRLGLTHAGTTFMTEAAHRQGFFPVRNFQGGRLAGIEKLFAEEFERIKVGNFGCYSCLTRCGQVHRVTEGPHRGACSEGPEYETIWAFGGQVGNTDRGAIVAADDLCDRLGLDTISTGNTIGFACELFERGIISTRETGGLELTWGHAPAFLTLIEKIGRREGFGDVLAEGVKRAAARIGRGAAAYAMHVKGLELPGYEPRAVKGYGLSYATSNIGGSHMYGRPRHELYGQVDRFSEEEKGHLIAEVQVQQAADETLITCNFGNSGLTAELLGQLLLAATGHREWADEACRRKVGERIVCLERAFNVREGFSRRDDTLPRRMFTEPLPDAGEATGQFFRNLDRLLDEYYDALGYTRQGIPSQRKLEELGLQGVKFDLPKFARCKREAMGEPG